MYIKHLCVCVCVCGGISALCSLFTYQLGNANLQNYNTEIRFIELFHIYPPFILLVNRFCFAYFVSFKI